MAGKGKKVILVKTRKQRQPRRVPRPIAGTSKAGMRRLTKSMGLMGVGKVPRIAATDAGRKFVECALDPLSAMSMKSQGVPDMFSGKTVVVDHKVDITITPDSNGNISLCMLPTLPGGIYVYGGGTTATEPTIVGGYTSVDGNVINQPWGTAFAYTGYSGIPYQEYVPSTGAGGAGGNLPSMNPYNAAKARIVSMGLELSDKSTSLNSQGDITVVQVPFKWSTESTVGKASAQGVSTTQGTYWQREVDKPINTDAQATNVAGYVCMKPKEGAYAVAKRASPNWNMQDWSPSNYSTSTPPTNAWNVQMTCGVLDQYSATTTGGISQMPYFYTSKGSSDVIGFSMVDNNTSAIFVTMTGLNTTTPQPIRVIGSTCVEYVLQPVSTVAKFVAPSPREDPVALRTVSDAQTIMPMAVKGREKQGFFGTLLGLLGKGVRGLANAGLGVASEIAAGANSIVSAFVPEFRG